MKYLLPLLLLCACKTTSESESRIHATTAETLDTGTRTETHTEEAPGKTTTTVREYAPLEAAPDVTPDPTHPRLAPVGRGTGSGASTPQPSATLPDHGPLVKETVTITEQGQIDTTITSDLKSQQREDTVLDGTSKQKSTFDFMHSPLMWIGAGVVALLVLGVVLYVALKARKVVSIP